MNPHSYIIYTEKINFKNTRYDYANTKCVSTCIYSCSLLEKFIRDVFLPHVEFNSLL